MLVIVHSLLPHKYPGALEVIIETFLGITLKNYSSNKYISNASKHKHQAQKPQSKGLSKIRWKHTQRHAQDRGCKIGR